MPKESIAVKIKKNEGEKALTVANKLNLTDKSLQIQKIDSGMLLIPLTREPEEEELELLRQNMPDLQMTSAIFSEKRGPEKTLAEILEKELWPELVELLPRALDIIGDIAIIEIPAGLESYKKIIGEAILKTHKSVRVVLAKAGKVTGTFRLREFDFIAGEHRTNTLYKEYDCSYYVDVARAYFSPRLSHEHQRVAQLVHKGETVIDLFAGVGPFALLIAKKNKEAKVYAIDINPDAIELLKKNAFFNKVENKVYPIVGDARQVVSEKMQGIADRVIMNLPETANEFIDVACKAIKPAGGVVHFYGFVRLPETIVDMKRSFAESVERFGRKVTAYEYAKPVRATAPYECQAVLDALIC
jgi:tRNA (guanine37-N1)-methyltransferase